MTDDREVTVYLLHFAEPVGGKRHYVGSCLSRRLAARLGEHARGQGASLTRRAAEQGVAVQVARLWTSPDRSLERRVKTGSHFAKRCPICADGGAPSLPGIKYPELGSPVFSGNWTPVAW